MEANHPTAQIKPQDHRVKHRSSLHANENQEVELFVREYDGTRNEASRKCVLMVHGRSSPALASFDMGYGNNRWDQYSWAQALANSGFDVFMFDFQGIGLSPLEQMKYACNASKAQQREILIPNPLREECDPNYRYVLSTSKSEWEELDTVVNFIRNKPGVSKVALIGYSAGAAAVGPYTAQHLDKVDRVLFVAPVFIPNSGTSAPALPQPGIPMIVQSKTGFKNAWKNELQCPGQREDGMLEFVWESLMKIDEIGSHWGGAVYGQPEGVLRFRNVTRWGWNKETVGQGSLGNGVPVCIIYGENDYTVTNSPFSVVQLYKYIPGDKKLMFKVACTSHLLIWEKLAHILHTYSKQWLKEGEVEGHRTGSWYRNKDGRITQAVATHA